jgi:hypothetical protein
MVTQAERTKELEKKISEQIVQGFTYQDVILLARHTYDIARFAKQIHSRITSIEMRYEKLKQMYELCCSVIGDKSSSPSPDAATLLEEQTRYNSKGALLMHKVFTGNLGNKIEIAKLNDVAEPLSSMDGTVERLGEAS